MPRQPRSSTADGVFAALANPTRRDVLDLLLAGPQPVSRIAARFEMSRPSVSEHLKVLRDAGLVTETRAGRQRLYAVSAQPLAELRDWLTPYERFWRSALSDLAGYLDEAAGRPASSSVDLNPEAK
ncbi:metalloregulator ArsR/SmtB family transcription factor [Pseudonocardia acidicola]|uniref:Winged helix-turn-helix transcriptional regulator n=1 Tax=Pseudonocardia acidicola TaxID=2724939 RepID=A0ABX1S4S8_9PSEU|nr:winged helix-turn-helix transcriptional regulator [Pseudonocardia acidicola]